MLKQGLLTALVTFLFTVTPAMADHHEKNGDSHKGVEHPAHEMGEEVTDKNYEKEKDVSEEYKENVEEAKDSKGTKHPAHDMGEGEEMLDKRGVE
ncbi:MAG: hypothetical protein VYB22_10990 [Pseudomonadota bacterium]|jgi:hypothetical protein|nr:hypothetical protein [Pseudomonadota bacterium]MED5509852.1 hypothetical protein [Pseudomonadota bacterium]